ncbi:MAG: PD-(D/E)XK nuclease-like domain-containing protein [Opitutales bacterium]|nr:PD-(D/E)XK nuclease-like domain-containing protein [Opitutales bacterium]
MIPAVTLPVGKLIGLPNDSYHDAPAISHSKVEDFRKRASFYYAKHIAKRMEREETEDMLVGHASHTLILEGEDVYAARYGVLPENCPRKGTNVYKAAVEAILAGRETPPCILTFEQDKLNRRLRESVLRNTVARAILEDPGFVPEVTWRVRLANGLYLQCRTDGWIESLAPATAEILKRACIPAEAGQSLAADLKTCGSLCGDDMGSFDKGALNYGYPRQRAFYEPIIGAVRGAAPDHFLFIAVEKSEPFETGVMTFDAATMEIAAAENGNDTAALIDCYKSDDWSGVSQEAVIHKELPEWYLRRAENSLARNLNL